MIEKTFFNKEPTIWLNFLKYSPDQLEHLVEDDDFKQAVINLPEHEDIRPMLPKKLTLDTLMKTLCLVDKIFPADSVTDNVLTSFSEHKNARDFFHSINMAPIDFFSNCGMDKNCINKMKKKKMTVSDLLHKMPHVFYPPFYNQVLMHNY